MFIVGPLVVCLAVRYTGKGQGANASRNAGSPLMS